jgi:hypothetical protein
MDVRAVEEKSGTGSKTLEEPRFQVCWFRQELSDDMKAEGCFPRLKREQCPALLVSKKNHVVLI